MRCWMLRHSFVAFHARNENDSKVKEQDAIKQKFGIETTPFLLKQQIYHRNHASYIG